MTKKDKSIKDVLRQLKVRMGSNFLCVVDDWDADLCAIGVARPDNHSVLAYICTFKQPPGHYFVSLELPPQPNDDLPYTPAGEMVVNSFEELVEVIQRHFASYP